METTVWNPQKGRLETIDVEFTKENTTWFDDCEDSHGIFSITDLQGGLLIKEADYTYPLYVYDIYRADIGHDHGRARAAHSQYQLEGRHSPPSDTQVIRRSPIGQDPVLTGGKSSVATRRAESAQIGRHSPGDRLTESADRPMELLLPLVRSRKIHAGTRLNNRKRLSADARRQYG